jgi:hypothetical protein
MAGERDGEDSLLERVTAGAEERQLSQKYTPLKLITWTAVEGIGVLEMFANGTGQSSTRRQPVSCWSNMA